MPVVEPAERLLQFTARAPKIARQQAKNLPLSGLVRATPIIAAMLFRAAELKAIQAGEIDLAFRRWARPRLRQGTHMRTAIGLVEVTAVEPVAVGSISAGEARRAGAGTCEELIARLDKRNPDEPIYRISLRFAGADPRIALRENADLTEDELAQIIQRLDRLDRARDEPWTRAMLTLIERNPATKAAEIAEEAGRDLLAFKRDVRKLKELGLTESLERGYRLSPRGRVVLHRTGPGPAAPRASARSAPLRP